ncbi:hypothetical protein ABIE26_004267 [Pedobacter africanus]|uniref:Uncharacterized protein n=1 Tax=Pedobacter africanus TaxID=151894 RepID=A0ACC6L2F4_9SPHI|nr:hypothetical protein [Pedobacter africanus]MDR6785557.1 hypothetical protein [Pedobacter africanus]
MRTFNTIRLLYICLTLLIAFSSCRKQEDLFEFVEQPAPVPPPPPPLSNDQKNVKFKYNGAEKESSMSARRTFIDVYSGTPSATAHYRKGFEFIVRLDDDLYDYSTLRVSLPLDENGNPKPGTYSIQNNEATEGNGTDIAYRAASASTTFPNTRYSTQKDKFIFNLSLRLEKFDPLTHEVAGVIDELSIQDKTESSKRISLSDLGFNLVYDHFEIYLNDVFTYEGSTDPNGSSFWYTGNGTSNLYLTSGTAPFDGATALFNLADFKGIGNYSSETTLDPDYGPTSALMISDGSGVAMIDEYAVPLINPSTTEIKVETFVENVLIRGSFTANEAKLWGNNSGGYYPNTLIPGKPVYKISGSFFQRQL